MRKKIFMIIVLLFSVNFIFANYSWYSEMVTKDTKKDKTTSKVKLFYRICDTALRMDFVELEGKQTQQGYDKSVYWLYKGDSVYIVNSKEKKYTVMSLDAILQMSAIAGKIVKIKIKDYSLNKEVLGAEKIDSYECKHIKLKKEYTMQMKVAFIKQSTKMESEEELWITNDISLANKSLFNRSYKTGFEDLDKMIEKEMAAYAKSFIMKSIRKDIIKNKKGKVQSTTLMTTTVSELKKESFDKKIFEIPKDYEMAPLFGLGEEEGEGKSKKPKFKLF